MATIFNVLSFPTLRICNELMKCKRPISINKHIQSQPPGSLIYKMSSTSKTCADFSPEKMFYQQEDQLCRKCLDEETSVPLHDYDYSERWEFLKSLPHKLIRDIAFVIASPDLLLDSDELPTVTADMLGGDARKWNESKNWLKELEMQHVNDWFGARKCRTRLGDHFAACIEYVLRFSPVVQVEGLVVSQQVMEQIDIDGRHSFRQKIGLRSERNIWQPVSQQSENLETSLNRTDLSELNILQMSEGDLNMALMVDIEDNDAEHHGVCCENQRQQNKLFKKRNKLKSRKTLIRTIGEFDFLFQQAHVNHRAPKSTTSCKLYAGGFESITHDFSESDFPEKDVFVKVQHWEASVKFLLYAGPWEAFGFQTPESATWEEKRVDDSLEESNLHEHNHQGSPDSTIANPSTLSESAFENSEFFGCFLGPHVGETLYDRKCRLQNQLALSQNPLAASFLHRTYVISELSEQVEFTECCSDGLGSKGDDLMMVGNKPVLEIVPGAVLKGFLFYECKLWELLRKLQRGNKAFYSYDLCSRLTPNSSTDGQVMDPNPLFKTHSERTFTLPKMNHHFECYHVKLKPNRSMLNPHHWMGWWTHIDEFPKFAGFAACEKSRWYIVPKQEWLSPVIINGSDLDGCAKVLTLEEFLAVAAKVGEEAALTRIPRKRRFMVAEVCWETDFTYTKRSEGQLEESHCLPLHSSGIWVETSRGFVVEETWPDSRVYRPHGYLSSWSPSLQQGFK